MPIPNCKDIIDLLKKGLTIEAQEKIMQLREAAMELQEENLVLREKASQFEEEAKKAKDLGKISCGESLVYQLPDTGVPLCPVCYEKDQN